MTLIKLSHCRIRKVCKSDVDLILEWENDPALWPVTDDAGPFTREDILNFLARSTSLEKDNQERWILEDEIGNSIGCIDLFDFDEASESCGIGVVIPILENRRKGYAFSGIRQIIQKLKLESKIARLTCMIFPENIASIQLFQKLGFTQIGKGIFKGKEVYIFELNLQI
jgi:diamine N-acetyltransferase